MRLKSVKIPIMVTIIIVIINIDCSHTDIDNIFITNNDILISVTTTLAIMITKITK